MVNGVWCSLRSKGKEEGEREGRLERMIENGRIKSRGCGKEVTRASSVRKMKHSNRRAKVSIAMSERGNRRENDENRSKKKKKWFVLASKGLDLVVR